MFSQLKFCVIENAFEIHKAGLIILPGEFINRCFFHSHWYLLIICFYIFYSFYVFLFWYQCQPRVLVQGSGKNCLILTLAGEISLLNQVSSCEMRHVDMSKGKSVGSCFTLGESVKNRCNMAPFCISTLWKNSQLLGMLFV